jgi:hypothetical protein
MFGKDGELTVVLNYKLNNNSETGLYYDEQFAADSS